MNPRALLRLQWPFLGVGVLAVVGLLLMQQCSNRRTAEEIGKWRAISKRLQADSVAKANEVQRVDSVFVTKVDTFTHAEIRFRTRVDSVLRTDTLTIREQVIVAAADTAIRACTDALNSCAATRAARDSLIRVLGAQRQADNKLAAALLRRANPRVVPYLEALVNPNGFTSGVGRAGLEVRLLGPVRLAGALEVTRIPNHTDTRALVGLRVTF